MVETEAKHAPDPTLSQRLSELITGLGISDRQPAIRTFAEECADRRNEISHFGVSRRGKTETYIDFVLDLSRKSAALSIIYQLLLLQEIGTARGIWEGWLMRSPGSYGRKFELVEAGLFDRDILMTKLISSPLQKQ